MQMIGKDNPGVDAKGRAGAHPANRVAQYVDLRHQQIRTGSRRFTVKNVPPGAPIAAIIRHTGSMPDLSKRRKALRFSALRLLTQIYVRSHHEMACSAK
jgi:hypothetical protein